MNTQRWMLLTVGAAIAGIVAACGPVTASGTAPPPTESVVTAAPAATEAPTEAATEAPAETPAPTEEAAPPAGALETAGQDVLITSGGKDYKTYLVGPTSGGPYPGIVLIHSINGLEEGYRTMSDKLAAEGFVVAAVDWQTFERQPPDAVVKQLTEDSIAFLLAEGDVDPERLGLTGFCAGGRYTMLLLPQIKQFKAGVAWYGFPYSGETQPASLIDQLDAPMLIIHGTADTASPIANINKYADELKAAGKDYEMKVYEGEPHGFMLKDGQMRTDENATDAFNLMLDFFKRKLG
jgi:carboxymethylenebutenolidase